MTESKPYGRDLVGYGEFPPRVQWPEGCRLALSFVLNFEEGGENSIELGDAHAENFITEVPSGSPLYGARNVNTESMYDYGSRVGVWRILDLFDEFGFPLTIFAVGKALELNPEVGRAFVKRGHEVASHHWRWIDYRDMEEQEELDHVRRSFEIIKEVTGTNPSGWYGGRTSLNSRRLAQRAGFTYDNDAYDDDLPHWTYVDGKPLLLVPYSLDNNDFKFSISPGFSSGEDFTNYLVRAFDCLYRESKEIPRMMSVGLHCRMSGKAGRTESLRKFLEHVRSHDEVWVCKRNEIASLWAEQFPPLEVSLD